MKRVPKLMAVGILGVLAYTGHVLGADGCESEEKVSVQLAQARTLSPDSSTELSVEPDGAVIIRMLTDRRVDTLAPAMEYSCGSQGCEGAERSAKFSIDGRFAVTTSSFLGGPTILWRTEDWKRIVELPGGYSVLSNNGDYLALSAHNWSSGFELYLIDIGARKKVALSGDDGIQVCGTSNWYKGGTYNFGFSENDSSLSVEVGYKEYISVNLANLTTEICSDKLDVCKGEESYLTRLMAQSISKYGYNDVDGVFAMKMFCAIKEWVQADNYDGLARIIKYPITVKVDGNETVIHSEEHFIDNGSRIINRKVRDAITNTNFVDQFFNYEGIAIAQGTIWYTSKGITALYN